MHIGRGRVDRDSVEIAAKVSDDIARPKGRRRLIPVCKGSLQLRGELDVLDEAGCSQALKTELGSDHNFSKRRGRYERMSPRAGCVKYYAGPESRSVGASPITVELLTFGAARRAYKPKYDLAEKLTFR